MEQHVGGPAHSENPPHSAPHAFTHQSFDIAPVGSPASCLDKVKVWWKVHIIFQGSTHITAAKGPESKARQQQGCMSACGCRSSSNPWRAPPQLAVAKGEGIKQHSSRVAAVWGPGASGIFHVHCRLIAAGGGVCHIGPQGGAWG